MQSIEALSALLLGLIWTTSASAEACAEIKPNTTPAHVYINCIAEQAKELADLRLKLPIEFGGTRKWSFGGKIDEIYKRLYGDVDSVYTISADYDLDSAAPITPSPFYIYADPNKHDIRAVVYSRGLITIGNEGLRLSFDLLINGRSVIRQTTNVDGPITKEIRANPRQGDGGGGREETQGTNAALASGDDRFKACRDAVQVGPRILEDPDRISTEQGCGTSWPTYP
jgi:hypothetical protein